MVKSSVDLSKLFDNRKLLIKVLVVVVLFNRASRIDQIYKQLTNAWQNEQVNQFDLILFNFGHYSVNPLSSVI